MRQKLIHCMAKCAECGKEWEDHNTARNNARRHAKVTGHKVQGEIAYYFKY